MIDRGISLGSGLLQTLRKGRSSQIDETPAPFPVSINIIIIVSIYYMMSELSLMTNQNNKLCLQSAVFQTIPTLVLNSPDSCSVSQLNDERRNNPPRTVPDIQMTRPKERQTQILETPASFTNAVFQGIPNLVFNSPTPCSVSQTNDNCSNNPPETVPDIQMSNSEMHVVNPVRNYSFHQESCQKDDNAEKSYDQGINQTCIQPLKSPDEHISKNIYGFDIQEVLTANVTTKKIVTTKVEENQFILRSDRQAVAAVLIDAVIERSGTNPSKNSLEQLARQLVRKYPGLGDPRRSERGWQMWFFHTVKGQGATGFLEDRLKNQRRRLVKKQTKSDRFMEDAEDINWQSMDEDDDPVPDDAKLEYLKHNFGPDIPTVMKVTVFMRRSLLRAYQREQFIGLQKAMEKMPRLFDTENMVKWIPFNICITFYSRYSNRLNFFR
ncbi:unnamed protein product [Orchesella dallaii]|uniref:Uncharacterized protein n=1 Tax=Orchesella dallaii TaxID=48710 RepID=A0ABP1S0Z2_9HEXA